MKLSSDTVSRVVADDFKSLTAGDVFDFGADIAELRAWPTERNAFVQAALRSLHKLHGAAFLTSFAPPYKEGPARIAMDTALEN